MVRGYKQVVTAAQQVHEHCMQYCISAMLTRQLEMSAHRCIKRAGFGPPIRMAVESTAETWVQFQPGALCYMNEWMNEYFIFVSGHLHDVSLRELFRHINLQQIISRVYVSPSSISLPHLNIKKNYHKKMCLSGQMQYCINSLLPKNHSDCHYKSHHLKWWLLVLIVCETSSKCKATGVSKTWRVAAQCWSKTQSPTTWLMRSANNVH